MKKYVEIRIEEGIAPRSIQTDVSAIRGAMKGVGRHIDAVKVFTSESLGVPKGTRKGKGVAVDPDVYKEAHAQADIRTAALMDLQLYSGMRINEVIECKDSLKQWERDLRNGGCHVHVRKGPKGGRARNIYIHPEDFDDAYSAIVRVLALTNGGKDFPIIGANDGRAAARKHSDQLAKVGIKGTQSSHSLRRAFAVKQYLRYLAAGLDENGALGRVCEDLGHGNSRGRWAWNNYIRNSINGTQLGQ